MTSVYIMAPLMVLLAVTSKQLILLLYTDKWIQAVPFMQVAVFYHLFSILGLANLQALNAIGRSDITIKLEFIKKPILMVILLFTCKISPLALSVGTAIYAIIGAAINAQPNKKQISYSYKEQLADTLPQITIALAASSVAYAIGLFHLNLYIQLFLQYVIGIGAYLFLTKLLRLESMNYTFTTIRDYFSSLQS